MAVAFVKFKEFASGKSKNMPVYKVYFIKLPCFYKLNFIKRPFPYHHSLSECLKQSMLILFLS
jgi:hypothetical protein